jgi:dynein intermediate chain 2, axonemal
LITYRSAKIFNEDIKTPIMTTKYHQTYLTNGRWSPTRPAVFLTSKMDGSIDVWDYFYKQKEPTLSIQVRFKKRKRRERGTKSRCF